MAVGLVDKNTIMRLKQFCYATLFALGSNSNKNSTKNNNSNNNNGNKETQHIFARPLALSKLTPLVLMAEKTKTQSFLIVGYHFSDYK